MSRAQDVKNLVPLDLEIESTLRSIRRARRNNNLTLEFESEAESDLDHKPEVEEMAGEEDNRTLMELHRPAFGGYGSSIIRPTIQANTFELKPGVIQMIQLQVKFGGAPSEDPNAHLENFLLICDTIKCNGVSTDAIRLRLFPFSLQGDAMEWLRDLPAGSITTWDGLVEVFLHRYFPPTKITQLRNEITSFRQRDGEPLNSAWARFKKMLRMCPRHGFSIGQQVETFYYGVDPSVRSMLDAAANGILYRKTPTAALEIISNMAESNVGWQENRREKKVGFLEMDALTAITAKLDGLTHQMAQLQTQKSMPVKPVHQIQENVEMVGGSSNDVPFIPDISYDGIPNHPNFGWRQPETAVEPLQFNPPQHPTQQRPPQQPPKPPQGAGPSMPHGFKPQDSKSNLEDMLAKYIAGNEMRWQNHDAMMQRVETQLGQLATQMATRAPGTLPSDTEKNPKGVNAVTVTSPIKQEVIDVESDVKETRPLNQGSNDAREKGASINLMPYSCFEKLKIGEVKPTTISLQLADRSIKYPRGIVEDVLVKVDKFIFPVDFVVLDMEEDREIPLILGRPFLATGKALIDVQKGELVLRLNDESVVFNVFQSIKYPNDTSDCFRIDATDELVECGL
ncbi:uncharacterized protein [Primulina eburnea]|uniref:uncharacterized protein n=1 Tax=Primulina eburnea TaxID=1245227 RepID=UPI003C6C03A4